MLPHAPWLGREVDVDVLCAVEAEGCALWHFRNIIRRRRKLPIRLDGVLGCVVCLVVAEGAATKHGNEECAESAFESADDACGDDVLVNVLELEDS